MDETNKNCHVLLRRQRVNRTIGPQKLDKAAQRAKLLAKEFPDLGTKVRNLKHITTELTLLSFTAEGVWFFICKVLSLNFT